MGKNIVEWKMKSDGMVWHLRKILLRNMASSNGLKVQMSKLGDVLSKLM